MTNTPTIVVSIQSSPNTDHNNTFMQRIAEVFKGSISKCWQRYSGKSVCMLLMKMC